MHPIHLLTSFVFGTLNPLYYFALCIKGLLIFLLCWWHLPFHYWCLKLLWDAWTLTIFIFVFFYFSDFILIFFFFFFYFSFGWWKGTSHCRHMTCHMMWHHRPRTWWKNLEDDIRAHVYNMVALKQTWDCSMNNRAGLIISSTDQACFV